MTRKEAAIVSAYTGILAGPFSDFHEYAERLLGRPVFTHEFANRDVVAKLKQAALEDFKAICPTVEDTRDE